MTANRERWKKMTCCADTKIRWDKGRKMMIMMMKAAINRFTYIYQADEVTAKGNI